MVNVSDILDRTKTLVWPIIDRHLTDKPYPTVFQVPKKYLSELTYQWKIYREYPERKGKYLRATLIRLTNEAMGGKTQRCLQTAGAMQLSEDWILVHDDIEDQSMERRGKPTLHKMYDVNQALNAGDMLHVLMWGLLSQNLKLLDLKTNKALFDEFTTFLSRTAIGQGIEAKWTSGPLTKLSDEDWNLIADSKSGYYTIAGPLRLGGIIAGASKKQLEALTLFGLYLGRCFQLVDDILDITSDFAGLKKQIGNDVFESKRTIMLGHLLRVVNQKDKKKLISIYSKTRNHKTQSEVNWVIKEMQEAGSIAYAQKMAGELKDQALAIFETKLTFLSHEPARSQLKTLISFILERDH